MAARTMLAAIALLACLVPGSACAVVTAPYFPLTGGNTWTFNENGLGGRVNRVLSGVWDVNGALTRVLQHADGELAYYTNDASGILLHREFDPGDGFTATYSPPFKYAQADQAIGATVSSSGSVVLDLGLAGRYNLTYAGTSVISGTERIAVAAGTFDALKLTVTLNLSGNIGATPFSARLTQTMWAVVGVGAVKQVQTTTMDGITETDTYELTASSLLDHMPMAFSFAERSGAMRGAAVESDAVVLGGFNAIEPISVTGGAYSVNGGAFTTAAGQVASGDSVRVRVAAGSEYNARSCATLTVGEATSTFCARTAAPPRMAVAPRDFGGDSRADILWRNSTTGQNVAWFMNGAALAGQLLPDVPDTNWEAAGVGDFDANGKSDILWRNRATGENAVWLMDGNSIRSAHLLPTVADLGWTVAGLGDFDADGKSDILWRHAGGPNAVWLMNGGAMAAGALLPEVADAAWRVAGVGDLNGDGKADVVWRHGTSGVNAAWIMDGVSLANGQLLPTAADTDWTVAGLADFDGDGKADLLWRHRTGGENAIWLMDGFSMSGAQLITPVPDAAWSVAATGDYDGDGKADIAWRNGATGQNAVWTMNGFGMTGGALLPDVPDASWQIVGR